MDKVEYLKMIQSVISRMAGNSFFIKGWCVTLVSAIIVLAAREPNKIFIASAFFPVIMFWVLDSYYLFQERLFRKLYNKASLATDESYSMDTKGLSEGDATWYSAAFSFTIILFYAIMLLSIAAIFLIALCLPATSK